MKIVRKALSGAIARHSGDGKFYAMPHNEALVNILEKKLKLSALKGLLLSRGLTSDTSFEPVRESDPRKF